MPAQQFPEGSRAEGRERLRRPVEREPERLTMQTIGLDQFDGFAAIETRIVGGIGQEDISALVQFAAFPLPDVVDEADGFNMRQRNTQLFHNFTADGLLGSLTRFDSPAGRAVENRAVVRVDDFGHKEGRVAAKDAESSLSGFDLHCEDGFRSIA
jgi:hypothetical protein